MGDMYKKSGVNLQEAEMLNNRIKPVFSSENSLAFAGSAVSDGGVKILTCCDGIGSKIIPLYERKMYKEIAVDLIAANLNDLATRPANAISFQDYIAVNKLDSCAVAEIIIELERELKKYGCRLTGGETSEVPHILREGVIDICGFAVGIEKNLTVQHVEAGDVVIGLKSSGIHANGFTLIRKFLDEDKISAKCVVLALFLEPATTIKSDFFAISLASFCLKLVDWQIVFIIFKSFTLSIKYSTTCFKNSIFWVV